MLQVFPITVKIYATDEQEAERAQKALGEFVNDMCAMGIAVTGDKLAEAIPRWNKNPLVKNQIINHFKNK
jgi:hypothetical protein